LHTRLDRDQRRRRVLELLDAVGLSGRYASVTPRALSKLLLASTPRPGWIPVLRGS